MTDTTTPDTVPDWARTLEFLGDGDHVYPFTEDEDANVTGYGHQDRAAFAAEVNRWDDECGADIAPEDRWAAEHIAHRWVVLDPENDERILPVTEDTPGAVPVTALWGQR